jgi:hypothetical protein
MPQYRDEKRFDEFAQEMVFFKLIMSQARKSSHKRPSP